MADRNQSGKAPQTIERTMEISEEILASVKQPTFAHFTNGKVHDGEMRFDYDEDGEICIAARLMVEPNMSRKDYGGKLLHLLAEINSICSKEYPDIPAFLEIKRAKVPIRA